MFKDAWMLEACGGYRKVQALGDVGAGHSSTAAAWEKNAIASGFADPAAPGLDERCGGSSQNG
ncbi:MAG: hypothetical protein OSB00_19455 [Sphingomonas bacterium]|nr:hypothetical protein [Sphingomonas bacterium]